MGGWKQTPVLRTPRIFFWFSISFVSFVSYLLVYSFIVVQFVLMVLANMTDLLGKNVKVMPQLWRTSE